MKLISMTDFVIESRKTNKDVKEMEVIEWYNYIKAIHDYADFLKQPLTLGMFVPCHEDGEIVPNPDKEDVADPEGIVTRMYDEAKERVLFEGFKLQRNKSSGVHWFNQPYDDCYYDPRNNTINTPAHESVGSLTEHYWIDLTLTPSAIKQIGL